MQQRDLIGYGSSPPHPRWPDEARIAVQFVLNIEEGAESNILNGDNESEVYLHELPGRPARIGERDFSVESMYEYGARAGVWRIFRLFAERKLPLTAFVVGQALELNPDIGKALVDGGHEIAGHGYRWISYDGMHEDEEREHIRRTFGIIERICGRSPVGWYTGRTSQNTRRLLREHGGLLYLSDAYNDDLPYWLTDTPAQLVIPYSLVTNDMRFLQPNGFSSGEDFFRLLKDSFDLLWREGETAPKMMSIGLHPRISGHPARAMALARFQDYLLQHDDVWICRREDIARHWLSEHPSEL
ncbi:putative urate catabolism protein [Mariprofundus ferrinatatus]|uniref:Putative urate catabolism protein n=1 Tax=Mariprofundus ferrinatatus TaxID=1921087 RepID=A0A2K8L2Q2_9PROT|nr:allantoinase PuuE [Mariprofundus ferrinatatus]ATX81610.1 putative urate catabolism protein [Mariprofundus ferrinatatus]